MKVALPIDSSLPQISNSLMRSPNLVISAAPGAGKTTRVPVEVALVSQKAVWVLEPRRIAAISAAHRIAEENGWALGQQVGYQVRFENKSTAQTKILFLTEALLMRKLIQDPELSQVSCVILDEFHERSLHVDVALAALKELQELSRPDLKIIVMSATLNAQPLSEYLNKAPIIDVYGKPFPLTIHHDDKAMLLQTNFDFIARMKRLLLKALNDPSQGDILCFLPGRGEIEKLLQEFEMIKNKNFLVVPLHGQLSLADQRLAILAHPPQRKIILATNIAESSLTVEGVRIVVDSGLSRQSQQDLRTGFEALQLRRISKASATQRAGRAARLGPGVVYRAWTVHEENSMSAFDEAEIFRVDLSETLLLLAAIGVSKPETFSWFEVPPQRSLQLAHFFLKIIGALNERGELTPLGKEMRQFPIPPRLAKLLIAGRKKKMEQLSAELAGLLAEAKSSTKSGAGFENDVQGLWEDWSKNQTQARYKSISQSIHQLKTMAHATQNKSKSEHAMVELLLEVYPDRLCRRRSSKNPEAKMVGGRGVKLHPDSSVKESEFFLAIELSEGREATHATVFKAVGLPFEMVEKEILSHAKKSTRLDWDNEQQKFFVLEGWVWNDLSVSQETRRAASHDEIQEKLVDVACERWTDVLEKNEALKLWWARLNFLNKYKNRWPLLSEDKIREAMGLACFGERSLKALEEKDLVPYFQNLLSKEHVDALEKECPAHWVVPTGNRYRIQYNLENGPQLEVRLQELFGLMQSPTIAGESLTLVLLAPNYRPVQVTRDLQSFWKNGYPEVRKEMRARYPKHSWPEDPWNAEPQAKGRKQW